MIERVLLKIKKSGQTMVKVLMAKNIMFPLEVSNVEIFSLATGETTDSELWHLRYGHINF